MKKNIVPFEDLHNPNTREQALIVLGQWAIDTCLLFGCQPELAWQVAATFIRGLRGEINELEKRSMDNR
jgi:hypothetical protein